MNLFIQDSIQNGSGENGDEADNSSEEGENEGDITLVQKGVAALIMRNTLDVAPQSNLYALWLRCGAACTTVFLIDHA